MAEKKQDAGFTVTDRRLFTSDGELRSEVPEEAPQPEPVPAPTASTAPAVPEPPAAPLSRGAPQPAQRANLTLFY